MDLDTLEEIITRAVIAYFVNRVMERLAEEKQLLPRGRAVEQDSRKQSLRDCDPKQMKKRLLSWEDAVQCHAGQTLVLGRKTLVSPLAADELAKRNVTLVRE